MSVENVLGNSFDPQTFYSTEIGSNVIAVLFNALALIFVQFQN